jgi:hypothetical protein
MKPLRQSGPTNTVSGFSSKDLFYSSHQTAKKSSEFDIFSPRESPRNESHRDSNKSHPVANTRELAKVKFENNKKDLEPWLNLNKTGPKIIPQIIGLLPNGEYRKVPTEKKAIRRKDEKREFLHKLKPAQSDGISSESVKSPKKDEDNILNMSIFLDLTADNGGTSNDVKNKMINITQEIKSVQKNLKNKFKNCPEVEGIVTQEIFDQCRDIYENNQVYYQQKFEDNKITKEVFSEKVSILEEWFICIIEPKPNPSKIEKNIYEQEVEDWLEREHDKLKNLYSCYCDPDIHEYLIKPSKEFHDYILQCHKQIHI